MASRTTATCVARSIAQGSTIVSPGSRSSWLRTALTDTATPGSTASMCALTSAASCSRSRRWKGRTSIDGTVDLRACIGLLEMEAATSAVRPPAYRSASADPVGLTRAQEHDELTARAVEADAGDPALLEVDAPAREVVDDLAEVGLVADDEHALVGARRAHQVERRLPVEALGERVVVDRLDAEEVARELRGLPRAELGAREAQVHLDLERAQGLPGRARLVAAPVGELALVVGGLVVRDGLAVPEEPELLGHRGPQRSGPRAAPGYRL